jgi:hypothetical protein
MFVGFTHGGGQGSFFSGSLYFCRWRDFLASLSGRGLCIGDQLDQAHRGCIAPPKPNLDNACVTTLAILVARSQLFEKLVYSTLSADGCQCLAASVQVPTLSQCNHPISPSTQFFRFWQGRINPLMLKQGGHHVSKHGCPVTRCPIQFPAGDSMAHGYSCSFLRCSISARLGKFSSFNPSDRPISARISLISLRDLRPKFLVLSISASVF